MFKALNYSEHFLIFVSAFSGCDSVSAIAWGDDVPVGITNSAVGFKICEIMVVIKKHRVIINKKRNTHDKTALLRKVKLDTVGILICDSLFESYITYVEFFSINNVLREYYKVKKKKQTIINPHWNTLYKYI